MKMTPRFGVYVMSCTCRARVCRSRVVFIMYLASLVHQILDMILPKRRRLPTQHLPQIGERLPIQWNHSNVFFSGSTCSKTR